MFLGKNNMLMVLLMLLVFTSQSMATITMSCQMNSNSGSVKSASTNVMHHQLASATAMKNATAMTSDHDCEQHKCHCPMSGCTPVALLSTKSLNEVLLSSPKISQLNRPLYQYSSPSLYRPPIMS
jgi:hypothetical protein